MKLSTISCAAGLFCATTLCFGAGSPWDGTWKLNASKSKVTGDTFTLTALPNGGFHLREAGGVLEFDYPCDGSEYPVVAGRTGSCKKVDDSHYEMAGKIDGKPAWHGTSVVSADGKYLTNTASETRPDGTVHTTVNKAERVGAGNGRAGTWRSIKSTDSVPDVMIITVNNGTMRTEWPAYKMVALSKLDGSPAEITGPTQTSSYGIRLKSETATKLNYTTTLNGKPMTEGTQTLSPDGKTLTEQEWLTSDPKNMQVYVYEKQ